MQRIDYIAHHGIKGQKWGVRRFQNKDGSYTAEGRKRRMYRDRVIRAGKTRNAVEDIVNSLSADEKLKLGMNPDEKEYLTYEQGSQVVKRIIKRSGNTPVAFFDILDDDNTANTVVATRSGDKYRGKGYAKECAQKGMAWFEKNKSRFEFDKIYWGVRTDNPASIKIAKDLGFKGKPGRKWTDPDDNTKSWSVYYKEGR
jgi:hypothetical protein